MAISKERLEELIEQGATIYWLKPHGVTVGISLQSKNIRLKDDGFEFLNDIHGNYCYFVKYADLTEDMQDAEFHANFTYIPRTEFLKLPTWEEFKELEYFIFTSADGKTLVLEAVLTIDFTQDKLDFSDKYISISDYNDYTHRPLFKEELTKENYLKACRKARELFLGKNNKEKMFYD